VPLRFTRSFTTSKVPSISVVFWILKVLTTAMGEATSDYFVNRFNSEAAVVVAGAIFAVVLWWQLRAPGYVAYTYWSAVVMVSVFGTMCADVVHVAFGVPYVVSALIFAAVLVGVFWWWWKTEGTLSFHSIRSTRRELFYWLTVTVTFALGTAVGDLTAFTFKLGFFSSGILFAALICLPALGFLVARLNAIAMFWTAYILTRPLGASFADGAGKPRLSGGLGWGSGHVALVLTGVIALVVALVAVRDRRHESINRP
jgi:uncharacterized membrane-anchored protein